MFFHGINYEYLLYQYPVLTPRLTVLRQNKKQRLDRVHLIEQFGFEPVHFLEMSKKYPLQTCLNSCFEYGNVVLAYKRLNPPLLQLSEHEVGVPSVDVRKADFIFLRSHKIIPKINNILPNIPIIIPHKSETFLKLHFRVQ